VGNDGVHTQQGYAAAFVCVLATAASVLLSLASQ